MSVWLHSAIVGIFSLVFICLTKQNEQQSREKRWLLSTPTAFSNFWLILGLGIPLELETEASILGFYFKASYAMPTNSSVWKPYLRRKRRTLSRWDIYKIMTQQSTLLGHGGRDCVLKAICEAADTPMDHEQGLFDEVFHEIFTPTTTLEDLDHHTDNEYFAVQKLGLENMGRCDQFFPHCQTSLLERSTVFLEYFS